jgi:hypothetical protein
MMKTSFLRRVLLGLAILPFSAGCVERRFVITTDPADAIVELNGRVLGASTADAQFTYYVTNKIVVQKEGYEMVEKKEKIKAPWYEYPGLDFFSENIVPWTIRDVRHIHISMQPVQYIPPEQFLPRAYDLREKGQAVVVPERPTTQNPPAAAPPAAELPPFGQPPMPQPR